MLISIDRLKIDVSRWNDQEARGITLAIDGSPLCFREGINYFM
jgi:hypothetical protein